MGVAAVVVASAFFFTDGFDLLEPVLGQEVAGLVDGEIAVGSFEMRTDDSLYFGVLVYAPYAGSARALLADVEQYRVLADATPEPARAAICGQVRCDERTPQERLLDDVQAAFGRVLSDSVGFTGNASAQVQGDGDELLFVAMAKGPRSAQPALGKAGGALDDIQAGLQEACGNVTGGSPVCGRRYVRFEVDGTWNADLGAHLGSVDPNRIVLGPLSWTTSRLAQGSAPTYVPNLALVSAGLIILAAILVQEGLELMGKNPFIPLPPLAVIVALAGIAIVAATRGEWGVKRVFLTLGLGLFVAWFVAYRVLDFAGVQYFSLVTTLLAFAVGGGVLAAGLTDVVGDPEELLLGTFDAGSSGLVQDLGVRAMAAAGAASLGALVVTVAAASWGYAQSLRHLPPDELRRALDEDGEAWRVLDRLDPARGGPLSRAGYASAVARVYGRARRKQGRGWMKDVVGLPSGMRTRLPGLEGVPGHLASPTDQTPLDALWRLHEQTARAARGRGSRAPAPSQAPASAAPRAPGPP